MPRYILIDRTSGYIFGDTADYASNVATDDLTPVIAARLLDKSIQEHGYEYRETERHDASATYDVYRADIGGSEAVGIVRDGQDQDTIDAVEENCRYVATIARNTRRTTETLREALENERTLNPEIDRREED